MGKGSKNRFTAFIETDDNDDTSGGVMLRNFVNDSHNSNSSGVSTPRGSNSSTSSGNGYATVPRKNPSMMFSNRPATAGRRNTITELGHAKCQWVKESLVCLGVRGLWVFRFRVRSQCT
jgi:hypothetical protein